MKILHLASDEKKFILVAADIFNSCKGTENKFLVFSDDVSKAYEFFSIQKCIRVVDQQFIYSKAMQANLAWCDCLVVHFLDPIKELVILRAPKQLPIVWSAWGGDYVDLLPHGGERLLGDETRELMRSLKAAAPLTTKRFLQRVLKRYQDARAMAQKMRAIRRVDFMWTPYPEDYEQIRSHLGSFFKATYTRLFYGSIEQFAEPGAPRVYGNDILVGNSATATNNHIEIFKLLAQLGLKERRVVVPLSYTDVAYREALIPRGYELLGERFEPVIEFMPIDKYNTLITRCSIVVMGHRRQQAGGNIITMMYKGAKVFLDETNAAFRFFHSRGAHIYSLRDLRLENSNSFAPLSEVQILENQRILQELYSSDAVARGMQAFVQQIRSHGANEHA